MKICSIENCNKKHKARGFCELHYHKFVDNQNLINKKCLVDNCNRGSRALGFCSKHYKRYKNDQKIYLNIKFGGDELKTRTGNCDKCDKKIYSRGLCKHHYYDAKLLSGDVCKINSCNNVAMQKSMCNKHYQRYIKHGDPNIILIKEAIRGYGSINKDGYRIIHRPQHINSNSAGKILEHRYVMSEILKRPLLPNENIHHINGNRLDNRPENLELWVKSQQCGQRKEDLIFWAKEILRIYESKNK